MSKGPAAVASGIFVLLLLASALLAATEWRRAQATVVLAPASIRADSGQAYVTDLGAAVAQGRLHVGEGRHEAVAPLGFLEPVLGWSRAFDVLNGLIAKRFGGLAAKVNWTPLGPRVGDVGEVRSGGSGRFHLAEGRLYLSTPDGSDPRVNGRLYRVGPEPVTPPYASWLAGVATLFLGAALLGRRHARRLGGVARSLAPGIAISIPMVATLFGIAEAYLRTTLQAFTVVTWPAHEHPVAGLTFVPGGEVRWTNHTDFWTRSRANSLGFLDREPQVPKPEGTFRVLVLGDSFVEAAQVPIEQKMHVRLGQRLREALPGRAIDVVAMGYSGAGTSDQLSFYEAFGKPLRPDLVVIVAIGNDLANNSPLLESIRNGWHPYHAPKSFFEVEEDSTFRRVDIDPRWSRRLLLRPGPDVEGTYSARMRILRREPGFAKRLEGWRFPDDLDMDHMFCASGEIPRVFREAEAITGHVLRQFAQLGRRDGFEVLVATVDDMCNGILAQRPLGRAEATRRFRDAALSAGLRFVDLYPALAARGDPMAARFRYDAHWSPTGHEWVAAALAEHLLRDPGLLRHR